MILVLPPAPRFLPQSRLLQRTLSLFGLCKARRAWQGTRGEGRGDGGRPEAAAHSTALCVRAPPRPRHKHTQNPWMLPNTSHGDLGPNTNPDIPQTSVQEYNVREGTSFAREAERQGDQSREKPTPPTCHKRRKHPTNKLQAGRKQKNPNLTNCRGLCGGASWRNLSRQSVEARRRTTTGKRNQGRTHSGGDTAQRSSRQLCACALQKPNRGGTPVGTILSLFGTECCTFNMACCCCWSCAGGGGGRQLVNAGGGGGGNGKPVSCRRG